MTVRGLTPTRSQAESWIRLGRVKVGGVVIVKPGYFVDETAEISLLAPEQYVSRAGLKLASVVSKFSIQFEGATVLDVGSSTGGFTDYALQHGAKKVYAVDVGTDQLHLSLRGNPRIELHEKTDIRDFKVDTRLDIVVIDVSFVSLRQILPSVARLSDEHTVILAMVKPQFELSPSLVGAGGVVRDDALRMQAVSNVIEAAGELGLRVLSIRTSRSSGSASRYLTLIDPGERKWLIRVSNHRMPIDTSSPLPHLDFVSLDGASGLHEAMVFLHRVAMGRAIWADPADPARRAEYRRARKCRR